MAKKKNKLTLFGIVMLCIAAAGAVLAIVGLFVPWFASTASVGEYSGSQSYGLFEAAFDSYENFPILLVRIFGIIAAVVAAFAALVAVFRILRLYKSSGLIKLIISAASIAFGVLAFGVAISFASSTGADISLGDLGGTSFVAALGAYFTGIGGIAAGASLLLSK